MDLMWGLSVSILHVLFHLPFSYSRHFSLVASFFSYLPSLSRFLPSPISLCHCDRNIAPHYWLVIDRYMGRWVIMVSMLCRKLHCFADWAPDQSYVVFLQSFGSSFSRLDLCPFPFTFPLLLVLFFHLLWLWSLLGAHFIFTFLCLRLCFKFVVSLAPLAVSWILLLSPDFPFRFAFLSPICRSKNAWWRLWGWNS